MNLHRGIPGTPVLQGGEDVSETERQAREIDQLRAALQAARDLAVAWMLTTNRLLPEQAVKNVERFDALLKQTL
jgi:hypothetical protein